jgi:excisionase family DNA binding protein
MSERLLSARELADHLGVTPSWVLRHWQAGELPGYRLGMTSHPVRFRLSEVEAWLATRRQGGLKVAG